MSSWMSEGIHHYQPCFRYNDRAMTADDAAMENVMLRLSSNFFAERSELCDDENPLLILTHGDLLSTEERIDGRMKICEHLKISETNGVYNILCLNEYGFPVEESDPVSAYALTEAVYRALLIPDRSHFPKVHAPSLPCKELNQAA
ncbi:hypothetical protein J1N35_035971 [Gossypium stocksii]|uniref:Uncharacterized protein n=1 Tax=Gossypium stocksii TaxID=47602 RepID=A0A9D3ZQK9_9ROSI|nr:hypothetical protein J1N35_035971 [Gossypium stocksii]